MFCVAYPCIAEEAITKYARRKKFSSSVNVSERIESFPFGRGEVVIELFRREGGVVEQVQGRLSNNNFTVFKFHHVQKNKLFQSYSIRRV